MYFLSCEFSQCFTIVVINKHCIINYCGLLIAAQQQISVTHNKSKRKTCNLLVLYSSCLLSKIFCSDILRLGLFFLRMLYDRFFQEWFLGFLKRRRFWLYMISFVGLDTICGFKKNTFQCPLRLYQLDMFCSSATTYGHVSGTRTRL